MKPDPSYYSQGELRALGLKDYGERLRISRKASIYGASRISIGSDVRIDDFCVLSISANECVIGDFVHIAVQCSLIGRASIRLGDFANLSSRVAIYSSNDDYSGAHLTNPMVDEQFTAVEHAPVLVGRHVIVGSGSVILPGAVLEDGVAIGALSLVKGRCGEFTMHAGVPCRKIGERKRDLLQLEKDFLAARARKDRVP